MRTEKPEVLSQEEHAAMLEVGKAVKKLLGKHYPYGPLGGVLTMVFFDLATLQADIDTLEETLQNVYQLLDKERPKDKIDKTRIRRRVSHIKHRASILRQIAGMPIEYAPAELLEQHFIKAD